MFDKLNLTQSPFARRPLAVFWALFLSMGLVGSIHPEGVFGPWGVELRLASSLTLVVVALLPGAGGPSTLGSRGWVAMGIGLGACGDASPIWGRDLSPATRLATTMVLFGLGHLAYLIAIRRIRVSRSGVRWSDRSQRVLFRRSLWWSLSLATGLLCWYWVIVQSDTDLAVVLRWPGFAYSLVLAFTAGSFCCLSAEDTFYRWAGLGGILFFASDVLLGLDIFRNQSFHRPVDWIWICYGIGQMLIVYSLTRSDSPRGWNSTTSD